MAKIHLDRLKRRYGYTGGNYQALMSKIIGEQTGFIGRRVAEINRKKLRDQAVAAARKSGRPIKVPDITEVLPARSVFIRKGAEKGKLLSDTLRDRLGKDLRQVVVDYIGEGKPLMQYQRGELRGRIKPELVDKFQAQITKTFKSYSRRDPEIGVPGNVRTIATTEVNAVLNDIKHQYMGQLVAANKGTRVEKTWVHHPDRSKEPRPGHARVAGRRRPIDEAFRVPVYARTGTVKSGANKGRAKWKFTGSYVNMMYPHDPAASADEVINCHCEADYRIAVKAAGRKQ